MENYGTVENYQRVYGGEVKVPESPKLDDTGKIRILFNRDVVFPTEILDQY